jgi:Ca2+-binding RTX toxin-like protein
MRGGSKKLRLLVLTEPLEDRVLLTGGIRGSVIDQSGGNIPVSGITIYIDLNSNRELDSGEPTAVSDAAGVFRFANLAAGIYFPIELVPPDYELIKAGTGSFLGVTVEDGFEANGGQFINAHYWLVDGTDNGDIITAEADPGGAKVTVNGVADVRDLSVYKGIILRGKGGDDEISIDSQLLVRSKIFGNDGDDTLIGGPGKDSIAGGRGADLIRGGDGIDEISGDAGDDRINGGAGNDSVDGGAGSNVIHGGDGNDVIEAATASGGARSTVFGDAGNDKIDGGPRNDRLLGGAGDDTISGHGGSDVLLGGSGNDMLSSGDFDYRDLISGGSGRDTLSHDSRDNWREVELEFRTKHPEPSLGAFCFLTSAVVHWAGKADDCHELTTLRRFRDGYMRGLSDGETMIKDYYAHAPRVVQSIEGQKLGEQEWPRIYAMVREAVGLIEAGRNRDALELYAAEYLRLKAEYL